MHWVRSSLQRKFALGTAAGLCLSALVFLMLFTALYREQLEEARERAAEQITDLLRTALENAMLKRDLDGLRDILKRFAQRRDILAVRIADPAGEVRFADAPDRLGSRIPVPGPGPIQPITIVQEGSEAHPILRSIHPVPNRPPCQECHGPVRTHPINGLLSVDFDGAPIQDQARRTTLILMGAGALIVLLNLTGGWWFMRRYVLRPVRALTQVSRRLEAGDLGARVRLSGRDELVALGQGFNTMAARLQANLSALQEKERFLQTLIDAIPDGIRVIDEEFRVILANETYRKQVGNPQEGEAPYCYRATHDRDHPCPDHLLTCPVVTFRRDPKPIRFLHRHRHADGSSLDVELYAAPMEAILAGKRHLFVVESIRDLEQEVRFSHEQKLAELGRLAAGVAHEIHNPLAGVRMALHAADQANRARPPQTERVAAHLKLVDQEVDRCIRVTERLLKLSMPPPDQAELVVIDRIVEDTTRLLNWEAQASQVRIRLSFEARPLRILATDSELRMVVLNLCQNAIHAMPEGGVLHIRGLRAEGRVLIHFEDTGVGIAHSDLHRIFEPFFSRRADGVRGTGLGLPITKSLVEKYEGTLRIESTVGKGTRVLLSFPDLDQRVA